MFVVQGNCWERQPNTNQKGRRGEEEPCTPSPRVFSASTTQHIGPEAHSHTKTTQHPYCDATAYHSTGHADRTKQCS